MKVKIAKRNRELWGSRLMAIADHMVDWMAQEDSSRPAEMAEMAIREILKGTDDWLPDRKILKAEATVEPNSRIWELYFDGSDDFDIWIRATARTGMGFIEIGVYLSDIWQIGALEPGELRRRAWVQYFRESSI